MPFEVGSFNSSERTVEEIVRKSPEFKRQEQEFNDRLRAIVRDVNATHAGQPVEDVRAAMSARFDEEGIDPVEPGFSEAVQAIADGALRGVSRSSGRWRADQRPPLAH
jgi:hypothetical protein